MVTLPLIEESRDCQPSSSWVKFPPNMVRLHFHSDIRSFKDYSINLTVTLCKVVKKRDREGCLLINIYMIWVVFCEAGMLGIYNFPLQLYIPWNTLSSTGFYLVYFIPGRDMQIFNLEVAQPLMSLLVVSGNNFELFYLEGSIPYTAEDALNSTQFLPALIL